MSFQSAPAFTAATLLLAIDGSAASLQATRLIAGYKGARESLRVLLPTDGSQHAEQFKVPFATLPSGIWTLPSGSWINGKNYAHSGLQHQTL